MGQFVLLLTGLVFCFFITKGLRQWNQQLKRENIGYCLLVNQYEKDGRYYGVFQQGDQEWLLSYSLETYLALTVLTRGELILEAGKFYSFEI